MSLVLIPASAFFLLMWIVADFDFVTKLEGIGVSVSILLGSIVTALYLRADRTLIVDSHGVRLLRSGKSARDIPWENMARFRYGMATMGRRTATVQVPLFWVHVKNRYRGLSIVESYYNVPPWSIWYASLLVADMARARGIPVVQKNGLIRDFGP